jgi:5'-3' exonuclease
LSKELATVKLDVPLENFDIEDFKFEKKKLVNENVIEFFEKYEFNSLV